MCPLTVAVCKEVEVLVGLFAVVTVRGSTGRLGVIATATPIAVKLTHINGVSPTSKSLNVAKQISSMMSLDMCGRENPLHQRGLCCTCQVWGLRR